MQAWIPDFTPWIPDSYGFQSPGFRILLQTFSGFRVPQEKTSRIRNPESLIFYMRRSLIAFSFFVTTFIYLLTWFNLCLYCAVSQDIHIICAEVVIYIVFVCLFVCFLSVRFSQRRTIPMENGNLSMPENLVVTDSEGRGKKLSRVEKEVSDMCVAVPFDENLTILRTTNGVARWVKIWIEVSCVRLTTKFSQINS